MAQCEHFRQRQSCSICSVESVFRKYQHQAKERGLAFELTLAEFETLVQAPCVFCGRGPRNGVPIGVDRRDNRIGYVLYNCQASCGPCNLLKKDMDQFSFLQLVQRIARYQDLRSQAA